MREIILSENETLARRFWKKVKKTPTCWLWQGSSRRYGTIGIKNNGRWNCSALAHRVSWLLSYGSIPLNQEVMHSCDVPLCVNPAHLRVGTHQENMLDCLRKNRLVGRKSMKSCKYGHHYEGKDFYVNRRGWRVCRKCRDIAHAKFRSTNLLAKRKLYTLRKCQGWSYRVVPGKGSRFQPPCSK